MISFLKREIHFKIYVLLLMLTAGSIPLSNFMISLCMIAITLNWVLEGHFKEKIRLLKNNPSFWIFSVLYLAHIFWLLNTEEFNRGVHDIRLKLPLIIFPFFIATSPKLTLNHLKYILLTFVLGVTINSVISTFVFLFFDKAFYNIREISLFISHIRFSLMIVISIGILSYFIFSKEIHKSKTENFVYAIALIWLLFFLFLLRSFTGIFIFIILLIPLLFKIKSYVKKKGLNHSINLFSIAFFIFLLFNFIYPAYLYFRTMDENKPLPKNTVNNNTYKYNLKSRDKENGYYVWRYICFDEMKKAWEQRSGFDYNKKDLKGHPLKITLIRYLTSKGLTKDSVGVWSLSEKDITLVEKGVANYIYGKKLGLYPRVYELIWEIDRYYKGKNPSGHSLTQRIEFLKNGIDIIKDNFLFGVGTGDIAIAFKEQYELNSSNLRLKSRLRTHNQYVTFFISFGFIGFLFIISAFFLPIYLNRKKLLFISYFSLTVLFLSMINEDTLETHVGVSLFSFLYSVFIFGYNENKLNVEISEAFRKFFNFIAFAKH